MVVQRYIPQQRLPHVLRAVEAVGLEDIGNAPVKALDHAISLRRSGFGQAVLNAQRLAQLIKLMLATATDASGGRPGWLDAVIAPCAQCALHVGAVNGRKIR